mmetsp:Transcript_36670/g.88593  ORF Transcript_36670/g.88593 Transcript_36670/m.88593 type:complete len:2896 (+) Transcript_36670:158-8845(+)
MDFVNDDDNDNDGFGDDEGPPQLEPSSGSGSGAGAGAPAGGDEGGNGDNNNNEDANAEPAAAESAPAVETSRWTCDACGCNTNAPTDRSCTVCGTPNGSNLLRRAGYARAGLIARSLSAARTASGNSGSRSGSAGGPGGGGIGNLPVDAFADFGIMAGGDPYEFYERHYPAFAAAMSGVAASGSGGGAGSSGSDNDDDVDMALANAAEAEDQAMAVLAMEVAGMSGTSSGPGSVRSISSSRAAAEAAAAAYAAAGLGPPTARSIVDAARAGLLGSSGRDVEPLGPDELWRAAYANGSIYQPKWMNPAEIGGRMRTANGIEVGDGDNQNVAYLPLGAGEGRALRALEAFPRSAPFSSFSSSARESHGGPSASQNRRTRRIFGFRVAFEHPNREDGKSMGGCYLIGVTTGSFGSFGEKNALQSSQFFWGIEDSGKKYEGSRHHHGSREGARNGSGSDNAIELSVDEAPRNGDDVLFGSKEVITCVVDSEARSLTFWRDENGSPALLGTLVSNLPRAGQLYPIVAPYNAGSTVAITGMTGDPVPLLKSFATDWKQAQEEKHKLRRTELLSDRSVLIEKGAITSRMQSALRDIFNGYKFDADPRPGRSCELNQSEASRLWYRCGLKLSCLTEILQSQSERTDKSVAFADFSGIVSEIVEEDEKWFATAITPSEFQVGDRVELVEGYERFGDAVNGPLVPGERGVIVELQQGPEGERQSIRVLHDSRRWWYQPQAIVSEKSGLTDSPGVWFLKRTLRAHGYDPKTLQLIVGDQVTSSSWNVGDIVIPKKMARKMPRDRTPYPRFVETSLGRITAVESNSSPHSVSSRGRISGSVLVEFCNRSFAEAVSVSVGASQLEKEFALDTRRIPYSKLMHSSVVHGLDVEKSRGSSVARSTPDDVLMLDSLSAKDDGNNDHGISESTKSDLQMMGFLDTSAIGRIVKICSKNPNSLYGLFQAGLPKYALEAMRCAKKCVERTGSNETVSHAISNLARLAIIVAEQIFPDECGAKSEAGQVGEEEVEANQPPISSTTRRRISSGSRQASNDNISGPARSLRAAVRSSEGLGESMSRQERRRMLLSLMSSEMDAADYRIAGSPPTFGEEERLENSQPSTELGEGVGKCLDADEQAEATFLNSVMRGRGEKSVQLPSLTGKSPFLASYLKSIVSLGIVGDSYPWLVSLIESAAKRHQRRTQPSRDSSLLKNTTDEDGTPLLQVAILLGCSLDIITTLIRNGARVGTDEIRLAADVGASDLLSELLHYTQYVHGTADLKQCSPAVSAAINEAIDRQELQRKKLRVEVDSFLLGILPTLIDLELKSRRQPSQGNNGALGRSIARALVGNVELFALKKQQTAVLSTKAKRSSDLSPKGLLQILPLDILGRCFTADNGHLTALLLTIEDLLCSKSIMDGGFGLVMLSTLLERFPSFSTCPEIERYGFVELVSSHEALALNQLEEISARVAKPGSKGNSTSSHAGIIFCPKKHEAQLHITKHSSFRCDLCGRSVEKNAIMFGCRDCDWDACESCTNKGEGGFLKASYVRDLAHTTSQLLSHQSVDAARTDVSSGKDWAEKMATCLESMSNNDEVTTLSIRILQADPGALPMLATMLESPGTITMHQFLMIILPALHSTVMGKVTSNRLVEQGRSGMSRRSKKPRVASTSSRRDVNDDIVFLPSALTARDEFIKCMVKLFVNGSSQHENSDSWNRLGDINDAMDESQDGADDDFEGSDDGFDDHERNQEATVNRPSSEFIRRLHQILALHETLECVHSRSKDLGGSGHIRQLKKPLRVWLSNETTSPKQRSSEKLPMLVEPLVDLASISRQIILFSSVLVPEYVEYCQKLVDSSAIILDKTDSTKWRIGKVVSFDQKSGLHGVQYVSHCLSLASEATHVCLSCKDVIQGFLYKKELTKLVLAARDFIIIHRETVDMKSPSEMQKLAETREGAAEKDSREKIQLGGKSCVLIGIRVDSDIDPSMGRSFTIIDAVSSSSDGNSRPNEMSYTLVSDDGRVASNVSHDRIIRGLDDTTNLLSSTEDEDARAIRSGAISGRSLTELRLGQLGIPFFNSRRNGSSDSSNRELRSKSGGHVLKRTFSAMSPIQSMRPIDISASSQFPCQIGEKQVRVSFKEDEIETPPSLNVHFRAKDHSSSPLLPGVRKDMTLVSLLGKLRLNEVEVFDPQGHELGFTISLSPAPTSVKLKSSESFVFNDCSLPSSKAGAEVASASSQCSSTCEGIDEICMQVLDVIESLAEAQERMEGIPRAKHDNDEASFDVFVNRLLSKKLMDQLENPLNVVGGSLPSWCHLLPSCAPKVFSYDSRKRMLDAVAFGVSRSTLQQQDRKINVQNLRKRAASLRSRAVELMDQAFSGECQDPTALQLQADELYGMEEALRGRIASAFRSEQWDEQGLEVAKAAVSRDVLISDAMNIMNKYASDEKLHHRRLEVRFEGESGFDAASGESAGVTRGYYSDIAEALQSCELVAGASFSMMCPPTIDEAAKGISAVESPLTAFRVKLPLWIPDIDSTGVQVIPTPRAGQSSSIGIFPRPISILCPQYTDVLRTFKFMGQLFASAMRDGFMFPLPLSASFLKLVQGRYAGQDARQKGRVLTSSDLPRPGFLAGHIYAVESTICQSLDSIDQSDPSMTKSERDRRYEQVASDKSFANCLGHQYQCSFNDYFEDRTFVDPLDPTQGADAYPLCHDGHNRSVTIHNIREWVSLAKDFVLHDGVIGQSSAFRAGVEDFFPSKYLSLFTAEELQRDVCGVGDNVDRWDETAIKNLFKLDGKGSAEAFIAVAAIGGNAEALSRRFGPSSPTIKYLVKALLEADELRRRQFLSFVTSLPIQTRPWRQIEVVPIVSPSGDFQKMKDPSCLPRANTCARKLYLPKFENYESFAQVLWAVIREESKHKGFWEFNV